MEASFKSNNQVSKAEQYDIFLQQFASLIEGETHEVSVLANTCAALKEAFEFFWVGFYLVETRKDGAYAAQHGQNAAPS